MLYIIDDKSDYHEKLKESDEEFLFNPGRVYFRLNNLGLDGTRYDWVVPLRSNIPKITQKEGLYLQCPDTKKTKSGNIAGFDLSKIIPFSDILFKPINGVSSSLRCSDEIAKKHIKSLKHNARGMFHNIEIGIMPTLGTNPYNALKVLAECETTVQLFKQRQVKTNNISKQQTNNKPIQQPNVNTIQPNIIINQQNIDNKTILREFHNSSNKADVAKKFTELHPEYIESIKKKVGANVGKSKDLKDKIDDIKSKNIKDDTNKK